MTILRDAYEKISDHDNWCTGAAARDARGASCMSASPQAVRWCAGGAIESLAVIALPTSPEELSQFTAWQEARIALSDAAQRLFGFTVPEVNDHLGHEAVLQCYEKAIVETEGSL